MSSDETQPSENGCASSEDFKTRKSLKSAVIADNDPFKIKLKITKRDIGDVGRNKRECSADTKRVKSIRISQSGKSEILKNGEEREEYGVPEEKLTKPCHEGEPKMKLRSKRDVEDDAESKKDEVEEGLEEKRKRREFLNDRQLERASKKYGRMNRNVGDVNSERGEEGSRRRSRRNEGESGHVEKPVESFEEPGEVNKESFCWTCHKDGSVVRCDTCPRVFHLKCVSLTKDPSKDWICPECSLVLHAEKMSTRSEAMKSLSLDQLCTLLNFAIGRMKNVPESQAFWKPVDPKEVPFYDKYITNPMDLNLLERNMKAKMYGSPQAFLADAKWLLHNSIIFNSTQSPLTSTARFLVKICRQEMAEIENCPDCYLNAHTKDEWFIEVCRKPHILIWARLKGFPFWPAKAMSTNLKTQQVDARFFGAHDKAWVPVKECYLYSKNSPQLLSKKRTDLDDAFLEADGYIRKIRQKYGSFCYAPDKTPFMPEMYDKQLQSMIPNYKEEKPAKKKRKEECMSEENGVVEKAFQNGKKAEGGEHGSPNRLRFKRSTPDDTSARIVGDLCSVNDYVSEEKIANDERVSPEDEIARSLEMFDTHKKVEKETIDDNSTDLDEDGSIPIPEHGYSRVLENLPVETSSTLNENECKSDEIVVEEAEKKENVEGGCGFVEDVGGKEFENKSSRIGASEAEGGTGKLSVSNENNDQCEVSSTSPDLKVTENKEPEEAINDHAKAESLSAECVSAVKNKFFSSQDDCQISTEKSANIIDSVKKDEERSAKSFVNLSCDQKQKILTEAKLLANIDEMTALGKQKVLNELGLDASQVDIRQMAQENRQILETLNKKCQNEGKGLEEISIKNEDFEQYLIEENNEDNIFDEELPPVSPKLGSIKVRDFHTLSKSKNDSSPAKGSAEPMLKIMDVQLLRDLKQTIKEPKSKRKKSLEDSLQSKKLKLEPVIELIKLDAYDKSVEKLNRKLRLSDEVSLLMVDGEKKVNVGVECGEEEKNVAKKGARPPRARKSMPNRAKSCSGEGTKTSPKNINVISVDTENSTAQKNLLKSLCLEEKKQEDSGRKTVVITTSEKGIKNVDVKNGCEAGGKKQMKEVTIEAVKEVGGKGSGESSEGNSSTPKNLAVMTNSHLIVTNNGPAIVSNPNAQPNLALAQNNLGQLSLVHLSNLTSGIQTNFVNLTNETIGFNNSIGAVGAVYATPNFNSEFPTSSAASLILTPSLTTSLPNSVANAAACSSSAAAKGAAKGTDGVKVAVSRVGPGKTSSGISVKSPASLGLVTSQPSKLPPLIAIPGDGIPTAGEIGSVTAELNKHSIKMAEYMKATIEDILRELSNQGSLEAKYKLLTLEMEKLQWRHQQEMMEVKRHSERTLLELRSNLETEKQKCLGELKAQLESQHQKVISETKRKQWCANCEKEALFYCCWNTSYCDYPCQQQHWPGHMSTCAQLGNNVTIGNTTGSQLQNKTPGMKYQNASYVPIMSRGGGGGVGSGGGSHPGGVFAANRAIPTVQMQSSQVRRSSDPSAPQLPVNITIRPQPHYFL